MMKAKTIAARLAAAAVSAGAARVATAATAGSPERFASWRREHKDGTAVSLTEGIAATAGTLTAAALAPRGSRAGALVAVGAASLAGYIDDHLEARFPAQGKGLKGHLGALKEGKLSSGALKILLVGAGAAAGTLALERTGGPVRRLVQWGSQTVLVAGSANLMNLLDLRPGRAIKAGTVAALPSVFSTNPANGLLAAGTIGAGFGCLPEDLRGDTMLGDMGANAYGAALGMGIAAVKCPWIRWAGVVDVVGLTLLSERYSFTEVIAATPWLDRIDKLGRPKA